MEAVDPAIASQRVLTAGDVVASPDPEVFAANTPAAPLDSGASGFTGVPSAINASAPPP